MLMYIARLEELRSVISTLTSEPACTGFSFASRVKVKGAVEFWAELTAQAARMIRISTRFTEVFISAPSKLMDMQDLRREMEESAVKERRKLGQLGKLSH